MYVHHKSRGSPKLQNISIHQDLELVVVLNPLHPSRHIEQTVTTNQNEGRRRRLLTFVRVTPLSVVP
jgi:hypothetical protein